MKSLKKEINKLLIELCWSLWTELGIAGVIRKHQHILIAPEELILLTAFIGEQDPRLRDEALDWCTRYHQFISISRLRVLAKGLGQAINQPYSMFAAALNSVSSANWPLLTSERALTTTFVFTPSGKSQLPSLELPSLLYLRMRSLFGVGARADLLTFFLTQKKVMLTAAEATEVGYTKRNLAEIMDNLVRAGIFRISIVRNQHHYTFIKQDKMAQLVGSLPLIIPSWRDICELVIALQTNLHAVEHKPESIKMVTMRNVLLNLNEHLFRLQLKTPPVMQTNFSTYWNAFEQWVFSALSDLLSFKSSGELTSK